MAPQVAAMSLAPMHLAAFLALALLAVSVAPAAFALSVGPQDVAVNLDPTQNPCRPTCVVLGIEVTLPEAGLVEGPGGPPCNPACLD